MAKSIFIAIVIYISFTVDQLSYSIVSLLAYVLTTSTLLEISLKIIEFFFFI